MKKKMKAVEIAKMVMQLKELREREDKYLEAKQEFKFPQSVSLAIAKNSNALMDMYTIIGRQEEKNKELADKKGIPLGELKEQQELLKTEMEVELAAITLEEINNCKATSEDLITLLTFTEGGA